MQDLIVDGPKRAGWTVVLAHGAGAPMDSPFMERVATGLADAGLRVVRFEFPYMKERRDTGKRRPPNPMPVLEETWISVVRSLRSRRLVIGGKSMGGRVASRIADRVGASGLVCMGYPFHPPGKPGKLRTAHLADLATPALILQGTRDGFGLPDEISGYDLSPKIRVHYLEDGDHSFKPRVRSGRTEEQNLQAAIDEIGTFVAELSASGGD